MYAKGCQSLLYTISEFGIKIFCCETVTFSIIYTTLWDFNRSWMNWRNMHPTRRHILSSACIWHSQDFMNTQTFVIGTLVLLVYNVGLRWANLNNYLNIFFWTITFSFFSCLLLFFSLLLSKCFATPFRGHLTWNFIRIFGMENPSSFVRLFIWV